jgi:energy-coupling factor transporter ATP-binding protein EcfA2
MNARLGFAIAAHLEPEVLLIDEVLAVGDFSFQQKCYERLERFRREGIAIAFVSHNMQAIATLCDRVLLLRAGQEPIIGDVATVLAEYVSSKGSLADPRLEVHSVSLTDAATDTEVVGPIEPCTSLRLDLELSAAVQLLRCGFLIQVLRSDGLVIFTGMSTLDGLPEINLQPGDRLKARIAFSANVLRGTYIINIQLVDTMRQWSAAIVNGVISFVVSETTRIAGCAEISPSYELTLTSDAHTSVAHVETHR